MVRLMVYSGVLIESAWLAFLKKIGVYFYAQFIFSCIENNVLKITPGFGIAPVLRKSLLAMIISIQLRESASIIPATV
jgi:hypothetical protein